MIWDLVLSPCNTVQALAHRSEDENVFLGCNAILFGAMRTRWRYDSEYSMLHSHTSYDAILLGAIRTRWRYYSEYSMLHSHTSYDQFNIILFTMPKPLSPRNTLQYI
jgi:hypothetical protein